MTPRIYVGANKYFRVEAEKTEMVLTSGNTSTVLDTQMIFDYLHTYACTYAYLCVFIFVSVYSCVDERMYCFARTHVLTMECVRQEQRSATHQRIPCRPSDGASTLHRWLSPAVRMALNLSKSDELFHSKVDLEVFNEVSGASRKHGGGKAMMIAQ